MARVHRDRRPGAPSAQVVATLQLAHGDRLLGAARSASRWLVVTRWHLAVIDAPPAPGIPVLVAKRPWHEVDAGAWSREASTLTLTFVDGGRPVVLPLGDERALLQVLRERVQASVVAAEEVPVPGRRSVRAVIRQDLATGALLEQVVLGRGARPTADIEQAAAAAFDRLREQTGMPPRGS
jgi:hypothetical protein